MSKETASEVHEYCPVTNRREQMDGYTVESVSGYADRTWVLITESPEGGWGIAGPANSGADIAASARAALAER